VKGGQLKKKIIQQQKNLEEKESNEDSQEDLEEREQFNNKPSEQVKLTA
jgi:heme oxygenase